VRLSLLAFAAVVVTVSSAGVARAGLPSLYVNYKTETCTFSLTNDAGKTVHTILPGAYQVVIPRPGRSATTTCRT
jgi:hypothetical protein